MSHWTRKIYLKRFESDIYEDLFIWLNFFLPTIVFYYYAL